MLNKNSIINEDKNIINEPVGNPTANKNYINNFQTNVNEVGHDVDMVNENDINNNVIISYGDENIIEDNDNVNITNDFESFSDENGEQKNLNSKKRNSSNISLAQDTVQNYYYSIYYSLSIKRLSILIDMN